MNDDNEDDDFPPALEDAEIDDADLDEDDVSSDASVVTDSSESISVDSDTLDAAGTNTQAIDTSAAFAGGDSDVVIHRFNRLMDQGIEEGDEDAEESSDDNEQDTDELTGDHKRRRGVVENDDESFSATLGEPIIVPLKTDSDDEDEDFSATSPARARGHDRRSGRSRDAALERNMVRRQSSNEMLQAMQNATKQDSAELGLPSESLTAKNEQPTRRPPPRTKSGEEFQRRPPSRTKSGEGQPDDGFQRTPPPRTKSGEGGIMAGFDRRAPPRTKSGGILQENGQKEAAAPPISRLQRAREQRLAVAAASSSNGDFESEHDKVLSDAMLLSPSGRRRRGVDKEMALKRNAARRQKSSDMLSAMQSATRQAPNRSKSSAAAFQRKPPARSKSGAGLSGSEQTIEFESLAPPIADGPPTRRSPPRTKSSDGRQARPLRGPPVRRAPDRTKSGGILQPTQEDADET